MHKKDLIKIQHNTSSCNRRKVESLLYIVSIIRKCWWPPLKSREWNIIITSHQCSFESSTDPRCLGTPSLSPLPRPRSLPCYYPSRCSAVYPDAGQPEGPLLSLQNMMMSSSLKTYRVLRNSHLICLDAAWAWDRQTSPLPVLMCSSGRKALD